MARQRTPIAEAFHARYKVDETTGCWIWTGAYDKDGYGQWQTEKIRQANGKYLRIRRRAPRISWELHKGDIPEGKYILHKCDDPRCVNPDHLLLGTPKQNSEDMVRKGRSPRGEKQGNSRLSEAQVIEIRTSSETLESLAKRFGVSVATVSDARMGRTWAHIQIKSVINPNENKERKQSSDHLSDEDIRQIGMRIYDGEKADVIGRDFKITNSIIVFAQRLLEFPKRGMSEAVELIAAADAVLDVINPNNPRELTDAEIARLWNATHEKIKDYLHGC